MLRNIAFVLLLSITAIVANDIAIKDAPKSAKRLVCYWGSWSNYRFGDGNFQVETIDPNLCTHAIYGFAKLEDNRITAYDTWLDLGDSSPGSGLKAYQRFVNLTKINPNLKVLIAIGGWNDGSEKYSAMVSSSSTRQIFVQSVLSFLETNNFHGLDIDWEYPATRNGVPEDKQNFVYLVQELRAAFASKGYLLTAAVSPGKDTIDIAYDIPVICQTLDFINIMSYDYHGAWEEPCVTGLNAPLYYRPGDTIPEFNVDYTINHYLNGGCPAEKMNMGLGLYGRSFTLSDRTNYGINASCLRGGNQGTFTQEAGYLSYYEICYKRSTEAWTSYWDDYYKTPYMVSGDQWVGYDDLTSITYKVNYLLSKGLGGGMTWAIDLDDFNNRCGEESYALLKKISSIIREGGEVPVVDPTTTTTTTTSTTTTTPSTTTTSTTLPSTTISTETPIDTSTIQESTTTTEPAITTPNETPSISTTTTTASPTPETPSSTTQAPIINVCTEAGYFNDANDCSRFYRCIENSDGSFTKHYYQCSRGLEFDRSVGVCNWSQTCNL